MGWTSIHTYGDRVAAIDFLKRHTSFYVGSSRGKADTNTIVDMATGPGGVYGVIEKTVAATGETMRYALVILIRRAQNEVAYKEMTEFEGPSEAGMPARLFNQLSPVDAIARLEPGTNVEYLKDWRARVRERLATTRSRSRLAVGDRIEFDTPLTFPVGGERVAVSRFIVREAGRRLRLAALPEGGDSFAVRLTRRAWSDHAWQRLAPTA